jgi:ABC-type Fe3+ transport system substrate-binding protein
MMNAVFHARFPRVKIKMIYAGSYNERAIKPLIALREGRYITDAVSGFGGSRAQYIRAKAFEDLRPLPSFKNPIEGSDPNGGWAAIRLRYWCMAYNTKLVDKKQLPEKWEDILTNPYWHNQKIGVASRPQLFLAMLWTAHGKDWVMNYMDKLFTTVKPQHRKEGLSAVVGLVVAGEFVASMPSAQGAVKQMERRGAPVAWHCPSPVPTAVSRIAILKGNPNPNGTRIWVNWLLSKEGQLAQFAADRTSPSHRGLQEAGLMVYPDAIKGKKLVGEDFDSLKPLQKAWNEGWERGGK